MKYLSGIALCSCLIAPVVAQDSLSIVFTHENKLFGDIFQSFAQQHGLNLTVKWIDQSELKIDLIKQLEGQTTPDAVIVPSDHVGLYKKHLYSEIPDSVYSDDLLHNQALMETVIVDGKKLAIPMIQGNHLMLYYNKQLVDQAATHWQQMLLQDQDLKQKGKRAIQWSFSEMYWFVPFVGAYGGWPIEHSQFTLDSKAMQQALTFYWDLNKQGLVDAECNYDCAFDAFTQQQAAYTINGIWSYAAFQKALGKDLGVALLPRIDDKTLKPMFSTIVMAFPNQSLSSDKQALLIKLAQYVQSEPFQREVWQTYHEFSVNTQVFEDIVQQADDNTKVMLSQLREARAMPSDTSMSYAWEAMKKGFVRYGSGAMTAVQASALMQKVAEKSVK